MSVQIIPGDCIASMEALPEKSVQCVVTSPPYWGLRDYGMEGQLGQEKTPEEYVKNMVRVFHAAWRVLKNDGTLWLNLGDTYASSWAAGRRSVIGQGSRENRINRISGDLKEKDMVGIPWMVAFALRADGWYLRQEIIWNKPNPMPESVTDRCTKSHEHIFLLTKSKKYYFDQDAIREPAKESSLNRLAQDIERQEGSGRIAGWEERKMKAVQRGFASKGQIEDMQHHAKNIIWEETANKKSVWTVTTKPYREAHFATYPPELIEPCILAGSRMGDTVLDPFNGSGTTGEVAIRFRRDYIGLELNPEYIKLTEKRLKKVQPILGI
jgi:DNA modification methylase